MITLSIIFLILILWARRFNVFPQFLGFLIIINFIVIRDIIQPDTPYIWIITVIISIGWWILFLSWFNILSEIFLIIWWLLLIPGIFLLIIIHQVSIYQWFLILWLFLLWRVDILYDSLEEYSKTIRFLLTHKVRFTTFSIHVIVDKINDLQFTYNNSSYQIHPDTYGNHYEESIPQVSHLKSMNLQWHSKNKSYSYNLDLNEIFWGKKIFHSFNPKSIHKMSALQKQEPIVIVEIHDRTLNVFMHSTLWLISDDPTEIRPKECRSKVLAFSKKF